MTLRSWKFRSILGVLLGLLGLALWVRFEAHIATTPAGVDANAERKSQHVELQEPIVNSSPLPEKEMRDAEPAEPSEPAPVAPEASPSINVQRSAFIAVPFVSQAPFRVWDLPYKEYCEEASALTVHYWLKGERPPAADQIDRDLRAMQAWEEATIGHWESTDAETVARMMREYFGHASARVVRDITIADIEAALDAGKPVIVPARGRELANPYFTPPGPLYHMLVVIGYDDDEFITNDVGTNTKGAGFRYPKDNLYNAIADWSDADHAPTGGSAMIIVE